jgi:hypothetical protein
MNVGEHRIHSAPAQSQQAIGTGSNSNQPLRRREPVPEIPGFRAAEAKPLPKKLGHVRFVVDDQMLTLIVLPRRLSDASAADGS